MPVRSQSAESPTRSDDIPNANPLELIQFIQSLPLSAAEKSRLLDQVVDLFQTWQQGLKDKDDEIAIKSALIVKMEKHITDQSQQISGLMKYAEDLILYDSLTKLIKIESFKRLLTKFLTGNRRNVHCAFGFADLTDFGQVNKYFGDSFGDELLAKVGEVFGSLYETHVPFKGERRPPQSQYDMVCRKGGDEFVFFVSDIASFHDCQSMAIRLVKDISRVRIGNKKFVPWADIGIVYFSADPEVMKGQDVDKVIERLLIWSNGLMTFAKNWAKKEKRPKPFDHCSVRDMTIKELFLTHRGEKRQELEP
ncbi:MAG TPA: GGDEF domain-containing protein [Candidatus Paceibacterota bacterium]|nr:GGDEF domain-containing protein [Candidatus Paceibacterota bacterium]